MYVFLNRFKTRNDKKKMGLFRVTYLQENCRELLEKVAPMCQLENERKKIV